MFVVFDGKRNDIGSMVMVYVEVYLGSCEWSVWGGDVLMVSFYFGVDSLELFVFWCCEVDVGIFVLVKIFNFGSGYL